MELSQIAQMLFFVAFNFVMYFLIYLAPLTAVAIQ